jgi:hypothetical protein
MGLKYSSKSSHPIIDSYFDELAKVNPDEFSKSRKRSREPDGGDRDGKMSRDDSSSECSNPVDDVNQDIE